MTIDDIRIVRLTKDYNICEFDCGNQDLNEFLMVDSKDYQDKLLSVTYILESGSEIVGYFSVLNDKISIQESDKSTWRKIKTVFKHSKHRSDYPAVKVGKLAINIKYQGLDLGSNILDMIKLMFLDNNRTGCAFITVDALREVLPFYLKNNFKMMMRRQIDSDCETLQLYYSLNKLT